MTEHPRSSLHATSRAGAVAGGVLVVGLALATTLGPSLTRTEQLVLGVTIDVSLIALGVACVLAVALLARVDAAHRRDASPR